MTDIGTMGCVKAKTSSSSAPTDAVDVRFADGRRSLTDAIVVVVVVAAAAVVVAVVVV